MMICGIANTLATLHMGLFSNIVIKEDYWVDVCRQGLMDVGMDWWIMMDVKSAKGRAQ